MSSLNDAALAYVRFVCSELDLSPTALAKEAGIASSTLTRPLNDPKHKNALSMTTVNKIVSATGISFAPFTESKNLPELARNLLDMKHYDPEIYEHGPKIVPDSVAVIGDAAVGVWRELDAVATISRGSILLKHTNYSASDCFALRMADDSMENIAPRYDVILFVKADLWKSRLNRNNIVAVERRSGDRRLTETSVRRIRETKNAWEFYLDSDKEAYKQVVTFQGTKDDEESQIIGIALYIVRSVYGTFNDA